MDRLPNDKMRNGGPFVVSFRRIPLFAMLGEVWRAGGLRVEYSDERLRLKPGRQAVVEESR